MKVLVCGGRDYRNAAFVWRTLDELHARSPITALMQRGALGADRLAKEWAATHPEIERYVCRAEWDLYGKAGPHPVGLSKSGTEEARRGGDGSR